MDVKNNNNKNAAMSSTSKGIRSHALPKRVLFSHEHKT